MEVVGTDRVHRGVRACLCVCVRTGECDYMLLQGDFTHELKVACFVVNGCIITVQI